MSIAESIRTDKQQLIWYMLLTIVFLIPISSFLSVRLTVAAFIICMFPFSHADEKRSFSLRDSWDLIFYFSILFLGLVYSQDIRAGLKDLETNFSFVALIFIFFRIQPLNEKKLNQIFYLFTLGLSVASVICIINALIKYIKASHTSVFFFYELTDIINSHPTYFAYFLIFGITISLYSLNDSRPLFHSLLSIVLIVFFFFVLLLTGGQSAFVSLLFVFSFFVLKFLIDEKTKERKIVFALACLMIISMFFTSRAINDDRDFILTDSWERFILWESALKATPNLLFGVGTGDYKEVLNQYYQTHGLPRFAKDSYNSHNQFIQILFTNGILGLTAILILIARPIYLSIRCNDALGILVFFPFLIYGMTEVFLGRYQGVVFFALFHQVFTSYYSTVKQSPSVSLKGV
jgi:O-antigen ligase